MVSGNGMFVHVSNTRFDATVYQPFNCNHEAIYMSLCCSRQDSDSGTEVYMESPQRQMIPLTLHHIRSKQSMNFPHIRVAKRTLGFKRMKND